MELLVTTSWDDGCPADCRVAELLARHGLKGTFYVPTRNAEGRPVMDRQALIGLGGGFEIGGHGVDHLALPAFSGDALHSQIADNRDWLAQTLGAAPQGFCYVRGQVNRRVRAAVEACGYRYARTTRNLRLEPGSDPFMMPTTLQFFLHKPVVYLRNFARQNGGASGKLLLRALAQRTLPGRVLGLFELALEDGGCFHLWGHSWELEDHGLWSDLETVIRHIGSAHGVRFVSNASASVGSAASEVTQGLSDPGAAQGAGRP
jgi:hypothetical protein